MASSDLSDLRLNVESMQKRIDSQDAVIRSQNGILLEIKDMVRGVVIDMQSLKEQNRSSSSSISRYMCPMQCGADFKKVSCFVCSCNVLIICRFRIFWITSTGLAKSATALSQRRNLIALLT